VKDVESPQAASAAPLSHVRFARIVADQPPQQWNNTRHRIEVVERYLANYRRSLADTEAAAAELGMNRRNFSALAAAYRAAQQIRTRSGRKPGRKKLPPRVQDIIDEVSAEIGAGASKAELLRAAAKRCEAEGLPIPTMSMITTTRTKSPERPEVQRALNRECSYVLDAAPLGLSLRTSSGSARARLHAVIEAAHGQILAHVLDTGPIDDDRWAQLLDEAMIDRPRHGVVVATKGIEISTSTLTAMRIHDLDFDDNSSGLAPGDGLRAVFGQQIGKVRIREFDSPKHIGEDKAVQIEDARAVVALHVRRRNHSLD
jgi:hypothetical protein